MLRPGMILACRSESVDNNIGNFDLGFVVASTNRNNDNDEGKDEKSFSVAFFLKIRQISVKETFHVYPLTTLVSESRQFEACTKKVRPLILSSIVRGKQPYQIATTPFESILDHDDMAEGEENESSTSNIIKNRQPTVSPVHFKPEGKKIDEFLGSAHNAITINKSINDRAALSEIATEQNAIMIDNSDSDDTEVSICLTTKKEQSTAFPVINKLQKNAIIIDDSTSDEASVSNTMKKQHSFDFPVLNSLQKKTANDFLGSSHNTVTIVQG